MLLYDTWACGGGDMRLIERLECAFNPYLLAQYLIRPPFDLIGGHYWVSFYLIIQTRALTMTTRAHGQQKLTSLTLYQQ